MCPMDMGRSESWLEISCRSERSSDRASRYTGIFLSRGDQKCWMPFSLLLGSKIVSDSKNMYKKMLPWPGFNPFGCRFCQQRLRVVVLFLDISRLSRLNVALCRRKAWLTARRCLLFLWYRQELICKLWVFCSCDLFWVHQHGFLKTLELLRNTASFWEILSASRMYWSTRIALYLHPTIRCSRNRQFFRLAWKADVSTRASL